MLIVFSASYSPGVAKLRLFEPLRVAL